MSNNQNALLNSLCPVCQGTKIETFIEMLQLPIHCNIVWPTYEEATHAPRGDIRLGFCRGCGHVFNQAFEPKLMEYTQAYENSLHFSPRFQLYAQTTAERLINRYDLHDKTIIEIGSGQGDFLKLLCNLGNNRGLGFDPSYVPDQNEENSEQITFMQDFYSDRYANHKADLICCRHVLEHIQFPNDFIDSIRQTMDDSSGAITFFEVPNVMFTLKDLGIWDLIYEHCSYFSPSSLFYLFTSNGFDTYDLSEAYEGQFLYIEASPRKQVTDIAQSYPNQLEAMTSLVATFADKYRSKVTKWQQQLEQFEEDSRRVVAWGAGSKGVTFLNTLRTQDQIDYIVDINPRKHGLYIAGTGQQIISPEFLRDYQPDVIILMNPIYESEIRQSVELMGLRPEFVNV